MQAHTVSKLKKYDLYAVIAVLLLSSMHLGFLYYYAVDIPFWDEWALYDTKQLSAWTSPQWYFGLHNEHRIVSTRILAAFWHLVSGRNIYAELWFNFLIHCGFAAVLCAVAYKQRVVPIWYMALSISFWLGPLSFYNLALRFHVQWSLVILFTALAAYYLFFEPNAVPATQRLKTTSKKTHRHTDLKKIATAFYENRDMLYGCIALLAATWSMGGGLLSAITLSILKSVHVYSGKNRQIKQVWSIGLLALMPVFIWSIWSLPAGGEKIMPWKFQFWDFWFNLVASGFGIETVNWIYGALLIVFIIFPFFYFVRTPLQTKKNLVFWLSLILALIAHLLGIATARSAIGADAAKTYRFVELALTLVPLSLLTYGTVFYKTRKKRMWVFAPLICVFVITAHQWDFYVYKHHSNNLRAGVECLQNAVANKSEQIFCPQLSPVNLQPYWLEAVRLKAHFVKSYPALFRAAPPK